MLGYADIAAQIGVLWNAPNPPTLALSGSNCELRLADGKSVAFALTRTQLKLPMAQFSVQVLEPQIRKLQEAG